jgi:hypothetical protein
MILSAVLEVEKIQGVSGSFDLYGHSLHSPVSEIDLSSLDFLSCSPAAAAAAAANVVISFYHSALHPHQ